MSAGFRPELDDPTYEHLRALARRIHAERSGGRASIQPTGLLHEAWMKVDRNGSSFKSRGHFLAVAARAMRQIMVDRARARASQKRGEGTQHLSLTGVGDDDHQYDILLLDDGLKRLRAVDERSADVVLMRTFGGLTVDEVAEAMEISPGTVKRAWRFGRAWLAEQMG